MHCVLLACSNHSLSYKIQLLCYIFGFLLSSFVLTSIHARDAWSHDPSLPFLAFLTRFLLGQSWLTVWHWAHFFCLLHYCISAYLSNRPMRPPNFRWRRVEHVLVLYPWLSRHSEKWHKTEAFYKETHWIRSSTAYHFPHLWCLHLVQQRRFQRRTVASTYFNAVLGSQFPLWKSGSPFAEQNLRHQS